MAVDPVETAKRRLKPAFAFDDTLEADIPAEVEAQKAIKSAWDTFDDQRNAFIGLKAAKALISRVILGQTRKPNEVGAGPAKVKFNDPGKIFQKLLDALEEEWKEVARVVAPEELEPEEAPVYSYPETGFQGF